MEESILEKKNNAIRLNENDNVAIALVNIRRDKSALIQGIDEEVKVKKGIPYGHKIAIEFIGVGEKVLKYGECMGIATEDIPKGYHVHVSNVRGLNDEEHSKIINELERT